MDWNAIVPHAIWATMALGAVGAYTWAYFVDRVSSAQQAALTALADDVQQLRNLSKEVNEIRAGLEKLKAIPPKQPRL